MECGEEKVPKAVSSVTKNHSMMEKVFKFDDVKALSLIDTGSEVNILKESIYRQIGSPLLTMSSLGVIGFGHCRVKPLGMFLAMITIENVNFRARVFVVEDSSKLNDAVIGQDLLQHAEVLINDNRVTVRRLIGDVACIQLIQSDQGLDIGHQVDEVTKHSVESLMMNYRPVKIKEANIKMEIVLKND